MLLPFFKEPLAYARENDMMRYLKPWHRLAHFLGIIPFADWRLCKFGASSRIKLYWLLFASVALHFWLTYRKIADNYYAGKKPTTAVMGTSSASVLLFSNLICFVELGFLKRRHFHIFLAKLDQVDAKLRKTQFQIETRFRFYFKAVLLHVFVFTASALAVFDMMIRYKKYFLTLGYAAKEIEIYYVSVLMVLIYNYSVCIGIRFRKLNRELKNAGIVRMRRLTRIYFILLDALRMFNLVFGWQLLAFAVRLVVDTLFLISTGVIMATSHTAQRASAPITVFVLKTSLSWILIYLLATSCSKVTRKVQKTVIICHKLMQEMRSFKRTSQREAMHEELFLLTQKIFSSSPHISAAGFFPVDYNMLFMCMSSVTSYLIVLIQFNK